MVTEESVFKKQNIMQQSGRTKLSSMAICVVAAEKNSQFVSEGNFTAAGIKTLNKNILKISFWSWFTDDVSKVVALADSN